MAPAAPPPLSLRLLCTVSGSPIYIELHGPYVRIDHVTTSRRSDLLYSS